MNVVTTRSGKQVEDSGKKSKEVKKSKPTPYEKEVVKEEENEELYVSLPHINHPFCLCRGLLRRS